MYKNKHRHLFINFKQFEKITPSIIATTNRTKSVTTAVKASSISSSLATIQRREHHQQKHLIIIN